MMLGALEELATREAVSHVGRTDFLQLQALHSEIETLIAQDNLLDLRKLNYDFYMKIYSAARMPDLYKMTRALWTRFPWGPLHVILGRAIASSRDHNGTIDAIEAGDAIRSGQEMHTHIGTSAFALMEYLGNSFILETCVAVEDE